MMFRVTKAIVAHSMAKKGGPCGECREHIPKGHYIGKVSTDERRSRKNGPGTWVCRTCAAKYPERS